jgi:hypothetical protein
MDKMKNHELLNSPWRRPNEINFILQESSLDDRSSLRLKNNLGLNRPKVSKMSQGEPYYSPLWKHLRRKYYNVRTQKHTGSHRLFGIFG